MLETIDSNVVIRLVIRLWRRNILLTGLLLWAPGLRQTFTAHGIQSRVSLEKREAAYGNLLFSDQDDRIAAPQASSVARFRAYSRPCALSRRADALQRLLPAAPPDARCVVSPLPCFSSRMCRPSWTE